METHNFALMAVLASDRCSSVPSRRGNQLNGNFIDTAADRTCKLLTQVPSRRGNQLNGNTMGAIELAIAFESPLVGEIS